MKQENYKTLGPEATITDLVKIATHELIANKLNAFEFDIHGTGPQGPIILHFEATIQTVGHS